MIDWLKGKSGKQKTEAITFSTDALTSNEMKEAQEKLEEDKKEEWIWVEGYKATESNMQCKGFQYELGKVYNMNPEGVQICRSGFHFSPELYQVFKFYNFGRVFKVKAEVRKEEWNQKDNTWGLGYRDDTYINKQVAKTIILEEEVRFEDFPKIIKKEYPYIKNHEDWLDLVRTIESYNSKDKDFYLEDYYKEKWVAEMSTIVNETLSNILFDEIQGGAVVKYFVLEYAKGIFKTNCTDDMKIYLIIKKIKEIKR